MAVAEVSADWGRRGLMGWRLLRGDGIFPGKAMKEGALKQSRAKGTTGFMVWEVSCKLGNLKLSSGEAYALNSMERIIKNQEDTEYTIKIISVTWGNSWIEKSTRAHRQISVILWTKGAQGSFNSLHDRSGFVHQVEWGLRFVAETKWIERE